MPRFQVRLTGQRSRLFSNGRHRPALLVLGTLLVLAAGCATIPPPRAAWNLIARAPGPGRNRVAYNLALYHNVWSWVYRDYYDVHFNGVDWAAAGGRHRAAAAGAQDDASLYAAINALLDELQDRHTHAIDGPEFARLFQHVDAVLGLRTEVAPGAGDGRRRVIEVLPGSAAAAAGVQVGWWLVACNGRSPADVIGPGKLSAGQTVLCEFITTSGAPSSLILTARRLSFPPWVGAREMGDDVLVLRFDAFDLPSASWLRAQLLAHLAARAVILDLRGNTGGHVFALASILGDVFPGPMDTGEMVHRGQTSRWHRLLPQRGGARYRGPLAVLVSPDTASAAEIFAQIIQENGRGMIIGSRTAGAVLTSVFWPLPGRGKLQISVYDYRSPKGRRLEGNGVIPDLAVDLPENAVVTEQNDPVLQAAVARVSPPPRK